MDQFQIYKTKRRHKQEQL